MGGTAALVLLAALSLAACGGGGGGTEAPNEPPQHGGGNSGSELPSQPQIEPLAKGGRAFDLVVDRKLATDEGVQAVAGGLPGVFTLWNPQKAPGHLAPGMKVLFFGSPAGCPAGTVNGPVVTGSRARYADALAMTAVAPAKEGARRWVPSRAMAGCADDAGNADGPSMVYMNPDAKHGGIAMYTSTGPQAEGFLKPYAAEGQNGQGANAGILGTFVAFRHNWRSPEAVTPWVTKSAAVAPVARVVTTQSVGSSKVGNGIAAPENTQVKQQLSAGFINSTCAAGGIRPGRPCQLEYLFHTGIYRARIRDWSRVQWFQEGHVWFDPGQGGVPVIDGPIPESGSVVRDVDAGLPLFSSKGAPTQHGKFTNQTFDVRISFAQLRNVLRIVTAKQTGLKVEQVRDADVEAMWGPDWNDPSKWQLLDATAGQEVHNPAPDQQAWLAGSVKRIYVGPQS